MRRIIVTIFVLTACILVGGKDAAAHEAWAVIDADTGRLLSGSNENVQMPIASLTKVWTAFTVLENGAELGLTTVSPAAASAEGSSIYLEQGVVADVEGLLYGLMLRSGNDAAYALAEHAGGSVEGFVDMMNANALLYGLNATFFTNPSGLHNDLHQSTAFETGLMLYYAMKNKKFREIASTKNYVYTMNDERLGWRNKHKLIHSNPSVIAGKTGFTKVAGRTLVTYFEKDGKRIIVVTLNVGNDWNTHERLAAEVFATYRIVTVAKKGTYSMLPGVEGVLEQPVKLLLKKGERDSVSHIVRIPRGQQQFSVGRWTVYFNNKPLHTSEIHIKQE